MTKPFHCDDKARLVAYLYDEPDGAGDREGIEAHLAHCRACAEELDQLRGVRAELGQWQPPEVELGFRVVREPVPIARPWWRAHAWAPIGLAAGLILAAGAALANVEVQVANGGITLRAGWSQPPLVAAATPAPARAAVTPVSSGMTEDQVRKVLADFETELRAEMTTQVRDRHQATPVSAPVESVDRQQILQQVRAMLDESERRQQRELALRLADAMQDVQSQRRADLVRIEQGFGQIESLAGQQAEGQRAITNYLVRVSQKQ